MADEQLTSDWNTHGPINPPLGFSHHSHLPAAEKQTSVVCHWPPLCVCVCPFASNRTHHLDRNSKPERARPWLFPSTINSGSSVYLFLKAFISQPCLPRLEWCTLCVWPPMVRGACTCQVQWRWHLYASCRDNEGFNFTTQAYQIAAPQSLRHAPLDMSDLKGSPPSISCAPSSAPRKKKEKKLPKGLIIITAAQV